MIPDQNKGARSATAYTVKTPGGAEADWLFEKAKKNLLNVNQWHQLAGNSSAEFTVIDKNNHQTNRPAEEGNYLRISIKAIPGDTAGDGFDWVKVEKIEEKQGAGYRFIGMRVRPCAPPFDNSEVAHFFSPHATSTFFIERKGRKVKAAVIGRNEKPNTNTGNFLGKLRNLFVAIGAMIGLNKPQWKSLVKGLLNHSQVVAGRLVLVNE